MVNKLGSTAVVYV